MKLFNSNAHVINLELFNSSIYVINLELSNKLTPVQCYQLGVV